MATYTIYGSQGDYLTTNFETNQAINAKTLFWNDVVQPIELRLSPQALSNTLSSDNLYDKNILEITVRRFHNRSNIRITSNMRYISFNSLRTQIAVAAAAPPIDITQKVQMEGDGAIFKFIIHSSTIHSITRGFTKELIITLGEYANGKISLLLLEDTITQPLLYVLNNFQPDNFVAARTNPSGGVKIP